MAINLNHEMYRAQFDGVVLELREKYRAIGKV